MFKNKKIVLFLLVLPLVAVLVAPKVALADDDSDWVKNIPIIGGVVDFASDPGGWITDRFAEGAEFFFNDGLQNIKTTSTKSILGKSFNNLLGKKTGTFYSTVSFVNKSVVMPTAASILSLVMLIQLIKISQRIDGTATLPAIKDIVFLIIYATIFIWLLKNSLKICAGAYDLFNEMIGKINQSTVDELKTVTIADSCKESFGAVIGIWVQSMIFDLITIIIKGSVSVMCYMRAMQLYVMAAFSPLPFELLTISVSAGVLVERGFRQLAENKTLGPLADEFARTDMEISHLGVSRVDALDHMRRRCDSPLMGYFCAALIEATRKGTSISGVLESQAKLARKARYDALTAQINKLSTKMAVPLVFFLIAVLVLILPPLIIPTASMLMEIM